MKTLLEMFIDEANRLYHEGNTEGAFCSLLNATSCRDIPPLKFIQLATATDQMRQLWEKTR